MTLITPKRDVERLEARLVVVRESLVEFETALRDLKKRVQCGEVDTLKDVSKTVADIRGWMKLAMETESQLAEYARKEAAIDGAYGLDLEQARSEIGCRLAQLRRCCGAGRVSE
ncbi:hypothetical protein Q4577_13420 [Marinovum sp. 2_MG-2023]|uniref:hypothetical protein n=1 Tax=Roseobacteraceae TaxID=2854170 RepID=UPI001FD0A038|nr:MULTISPECIES: hypothetical protein [Roseobacteraceae]MCJ7873752.1 hypothetical protein [Phaeobacter sp. J2-8]MDO6731027.1 hypothetical protein [Marinovum sp. 2_MG-2023]MDO6778524.1 hypothetical protein [Marinovum sp. 1_MG-2023]